METTETTETATAAQRKLPKPATGDMISSLPDEILSHILSFLPTKYAVGASVLSRRWKDLWTGLDELDLDNKDGGNCLEHGVNRQRRDLAFCRFADRVLSQHTDLNSVRRFRLRFSAGDLIRREGRPNFLSRMARLAPDESRLEEIDLQIEGYGGDHVDMLLPRLSPETFNRLKRLTVLKLAGVTLMATSTSTTKGYVVLLPSVKTLQMVSVQITDGELLGSLVSGCPVLETLHVKHCRARKKAIVAASLPWLKKLRIIGHDYLLCPMRIEAPRLVQLELWHFAALQLVGSPLQCLRAAQLHIGHTDISKPDLIRLLDQISGAKEMWLSWRTLSLLMDDEEDDDVELPILPNLTRLTIELGRSLSHLHFFLKAAPKLQYLCIDLEEDEMKWDAFERRVYPPECLLSSLKEIDINKVRAGGGEMDMVAYLLEAGAVLKMVTVHAACDKDDHDDDDDEMYRGRGGLKLPLQVKRRSRACEVRVFRYDGHEIRLHRGGSDDDETDSDDDSESMDDDDDDDDDGTSDDNTSRSQGSLQEGSL